MSEVRRWAHTVVWEGLQISATYMAINDGGEYVMQDDYAALEAECERLRAQVSALQSDANSWQSGYDKGREDGAKAADGWKAQHARDSAELRRLCAERDALTADLTSWGRSYREVHEPALREAHAYIQDLRAELAAIKGQEVDGGN